MCESLPQLFSSFGFDRNYIKAYIESSFGQEFCRSLRDSNELDNSFALNALLFALKAI